MKRERKEQLRSRRIFVEAELSDETLPYIVKELGNQALVFASDYPHFTSPSGEAKAEHTSDPGKNCHTLGPLR